MNNTYDITFFYNSCLEFIEKGIENNKYFFNSAIFASNSDSVINAEMQDYIYDACLKFISTPNGKELYSHFMEQSYSNVSRVYIIKDIVRLATFFYYRDLFKKTNEIDLDMDIRNFNLSMNTIKSLKEKLDIKDEVIRLKDVIDISFNDLENYNYHGGSDKKEIEYLVSFCNDLFSIIADNCLDDNFSSYKRDLLVRINYLEQRHSDIIEELLKLQEDDQIILDSIKELKKKLFDIESKNFQRKR